MSSETGPPSKETSCPDFTVVQTGVGLLPVPSGLAGQMHLLHHNGLGRRGLKAGCGSGKVRNSRPNPRRAPQTTVSTLRHHPPPQNRYTTSPSPRPPPSGSYDDLIKQWERLLTWATLKTLQDFKVMPSRPAREVSRRLARRVLSDYGPSLRKWLCRPLG